MPALTSSFVRFASLLVVATALLLADTAVLAADSAKPAQRPNIVFILADDK